MKKDSIDSTSRMTKVEREISVLRVYKKNNSIAAVSLFYN